MSVMCRILHMCEQYGIFTSYKIVKNNRCGWIVRPDVANCLPLIVSHINLNSIKPYQILWLQYDVLSGSTLLKWQLRFFYLFYFYFFYHDTAHILVRACVRVYHLSIVRTREPCIHNVR